MTDQYDKTPGISALFDLSFTRFITVSFVRILYILGIVLLGLVWLVAVGGALLGVANSPNTGAALFGALLTLIIATLVAVIYLIFLRVWLELIVVIFRIGENTSAIAAAQGVAPNPPTGGFPVMPR